VWRELVTSDEGQQVGNVQKEKDRSEFTLGAVCGWLPDAFHTALVFWCFVLFTVSLPAQI